MRCPTAVLRSDCRELYDLFFGGYVGPWLVAKGVEFEAGSPRRRRNCQEYGETVKNVAVLMPLVYYAGSSQSSPSVSPV